MEFKSVVFNAARDGKLYRLKVRSYSFIVSFIVIFLYVLSIVNFKFSLSEVVTFKANVFLHVNRDSFLFCFRSHVRFAFLVSGEEKTKEKVIFFYSFNVNFYIFFFFNTTLGIFGSQT